MCFNNSAASQITMQFAFAISFRFRKLNNKQFRMYVAPLTHQSLNDWLQHDFRMQIASKSTAKNKQMRCKFMIDLLMSRSTVRRFFQFMFNLRDGRAN